jgi:hypothetical protein
MSDYNELFLTGTHRHDLETYYKEIEVSRMNQLKEKVKAYWRMLGWK